MKSIQSLFVVFFLGLSQATAETKPNVLFLAVDDMNDWIGCLETTPRAITPNLDRLAARGVKFTNAHTAGVFCAPSRAAIFTGQFASTTGCYRTANYFVDHPEIEPLQVSFSKAGYQTFGAGKLFHHPAGAIDVRGWNEFFLRHQSQRRGGWPLDSWSKGTPFPLHDERLDITNQEAPRRLPLRDAVASLVLAGILKTGRRSANRFALQGRQPTSSRQAVGSGTIGQFLSRSL